MIAVTLRLVARPDTREELSHRVSVDLLEATRAAPGCLNYRFYQDIEDANAFTFVEEWRDREALADHFRSAHVGNFLERLPELIAEAPVARFHEISETRGLEAVEEARSGIQATM